jgi:hypothetical protein
MANAQRGEIDAELSGRTYRLCLTLGALAELEDLYGEDLLMIAERFEKGRIGAGDAIRILGAGLRGAGHAMGDEEVAMMRSPEGAAGLLRTAVRLLVATFGGV